MGCSGEGVGTLGDSLFNLYFKYVYRREPAKMY